MMDWLLDHWWVASLTPYFMLNLWMTADLYRDGPATHIDRTDIPGITFVVLFGTIMGLVVIAWVVVGFCVEKFTHAPVPYPTQLFTAILKACGAALLKYLCLALHVSLTMLLVFAAYTVDLAIVPLEYQTGALSILAMVGVLAFSFYVSRKGRRRGPRA